MSRYRAFPGFIAFGPILALAGCVGAASLPTVPPPQPTAVLFIAPPPTSLAVQASATLTAAAGTSFKHFDFIEIFPSQG